MARTIGRAVSGAAAVIGVAASMVAFPVAGDEPSAVAASGPAVASTGLEPKAATGFDASSGDPIVVYLAVPLCSNDQVVCGSSLAGAPANLEHNLYWGAIFGVRTFFERKASRFVLLGTGGEAMPRLERRFYGLPCPAGASSCRPVVVVADAFHGDFIDDAVRAFWQAATEGGEVAVPVADGAVTLPYDVVGFAGHNRLMDGLTLPPSPRDAEATPTASTTPLPSFVIACHSHAYFSDALRAAGSDPVAMTDALIAPEGYVLEALMQGLAAGKSPLELRALMAHAYASWHSIELPVALGLFTRLES